MLREELEYFSIPPKDGQATTNSNGIANDELLDLKRKCGNYLLHKRNIFTALQRNVNKENNIAEQHLIDMLCMRCVIYTTLVPLTRRNRVFVQRIRPRGRVGVSRVGTVPVLHLLDRTRAAQDRDRPSGFAERREAGHNRLCPDGDGTEATSFLAEARGELYQILVRKLPPLTSARCSGNAGGTVLRSTLRTQVSPKRS